MLAVSDLKQGQTNELNGSCQIVRFARSARVFVFTRLCFSVDEV